MTKRFAILAALLAVHAAPAYAQAGEDRAEVRAESLALTDVMLDAARSFAIVDGDRNGAIDEDEYAARRVVFAQLARFRGHLVFDGQETVEVALPETLRRPMTEPERVALDGLARREFQMRAMGSASLSPSSWQDSLLEPFAEADADGDGCLTGDELAAFAAYRAGALTSLLPAS